MEKQRKTEYLQFRITTEDKKMIENGAKIRGLDVSDYVRTFALATAREDIEKASLETKVVLTSSEWERFLQIQEEPSEKNPRLERAFRRLEELESFSEEQSG